MKISPRTTWRAAAAALAFQVLAYAGQAAHAGAWLLAQAAPAQPTGATGEAPARYYVMELFVVLVMTGAAMYAVCRTSRR